MTSNSPTDWMDVSVGLREGMPTWPGNTPYSIAKDKDMAKGDHDNVSRLHMGVHSGTHMDAPLHFLQDGRSIDTIPLDAVVGTARVIEIQDKVSIKPEELERHNISAGERILFKTSNSGRVWSTDSFTTDFVYIPKEGAQFLADRKITTVGVDYLSVGGYKKDGGDAHRALLGAGIWIIEGLDLSEVAEGSYELVCLPLKLVGAEGSPARAILRKAAQA